MEFQVNVTLAGDESSAYLSFQLSEQTADSAGIRLPSQPPPSDPLPQSNLSPTSKENKKVE